jgi:hypothetical protein
MRLSTANKRRKNKYHARALYFRKPKAALLKDIQAILDVTKFMFGKPDLISDDGRTKTWEFKFTSTEITFSGELTPEGAAFFSQYFIDESSPYTDDVADEVARWLEANESENR